MPDFIQRAFNTGEICEEAQARSDIAQAPRGERLALNGMFMVQGGWRRRKGTWFVAAPKAEADFELMTFSRAYGQSVMLELGYTGGAGYFRVYGLDRARVGTVDIATPFAAAELNGGLCPLQTGDAMHVYRRNNAHPQIVQRTGTTAWACTSLQYRHGPWLPENAPTGTEITFGGASASAAAAVFQAGHVGAAFLVRPPAGYSMQAWHSDWRAPDNGYCLSAGYIYSKANDSNKTGTNPPVHTTGTVNDAGNIQTNADPTTVGVNWTYRHDGACVFRVSAYTSSTAVTGAFDGAQDPFSGETDVTARWSEMAYSDYRGWPGMAPCIREERIVTGCTGSNPDMLDLTRTNGWDFSSVDYKPGLGTGLVAADDAMRLTIGGKGAPLQWALDREVLVVAAADKLYMVSGGSVDTALTPSSRLVRGIPGGGSSAVLPAETPTTIVFSPPSRRALMELSGTDGAYTSTEISLLFQHITGRGVAQHLYMRSPWHMIVLRLDDGGVAFVCYNKDQNVLAAASQDFGGRVFTMAVITGTDGLDQLWLGIERDGVRSIEAMAGYYEQMFLDSAQFYSGDPVGTVSGLDRWNSKTIQLIGDGIWHKDVTVSAGDAALQGGEEAAYIVAGLGYTSRLEFMPLGEAQESWSQMTTRPDRIKLSMRFTACEVGTTDDDSGDAASEKPVNKDSNGQWIEKRRTVKCSPFATSGDDKRVFVQTASPFDLVVYSGKMSAGQ